MAAAAFGDGLDCRNRTGTADMGGGRGAGATSSPASRVREGVLCVDDGLCSVGGVVAEVNEARLCAFKLPPACCTGVAITVEGRDFDGADLLRPAAFAPCFEVDLPAGGTSGSASIPAAPTMLRLRAKASSYAGSEVFLLSGVTRCSTAADRGSRTGLRLSSAMLPADRVWRCTATTRSSSTAGLPSHSASQRRPRPRARHAVRSALDTHKVAVSLSKGAARPYDKKVLHVLLGTGVQVRPLVFLL